MTCFVRAGGVVVLLLVGCAARDDEDPGAPRGTVVRDAVARVSPRARAIEFSRRASRAPGLSPASIDSLTLAQDGVPGSGPGETVELVTNSVADTLLGETCPGVPPGGKAFCGNVTLSHFFPRTLSNTFVQVTSVSDAAHAPLAGHQAINSDPAALGLDASFGLWKYTAASSASPGVLGIAPDNGGSRDWVFANPDDADTWIGLRIVASLTYSGYTRTASGLPFVDACAGGEDLGPVTTAPVTLPFPFTLYDTTDVALTLNRRGVIVLGASSLIAPAKSVPLPSSGNVPGCTQLRQCAVPRPAIFAFWDALVYNGGGGICTLTSGVAPDRTYAVTWRRLARLSAVDEGADYTFTAVLHEGTNEIDLLYGNMNGPLPNAAGGAATIGVQNAAGTVATGQTNTQNYGTGAAFRLTPVP